MLFGHPSGEPGSAFAALLRHLGTVWTGLVHRELKQRVGSKPAVCRAWCQAEHDTQEKCNRQMHRIEFGDKRVAVARLLLQCGLNLYKALSTTWQST